MMDISKLILGTVQIGQKYGIANITGKPNRSKSMKIISYAWSQGINAFDTAPVYGNSEKILGSFIELICDSYNQEPIIISKFPPINRNIDFEYDDLFNSIKKRIKESLKNLNLNSIPIYLLHHAPDLQYKGGIVIEALKELKRKGLIKKIGVSTYSPEDVRECLKYDVLKYVECPINLFDHRLIRGELLKELNETNHKIMARSIYLQGLFFLDPSRLPPNMKFAKKSLKELKRIKNTFNIGSAELPFLFIRDLAEVDHLVVGVETMEQLKQNIRLLKAKPLSADLQDIIFETFKEVPEKLINPSLWE